MAQLSMQPAELAYLLSGMGTQEIAGIYNHLLFPQGQTSEQSTPLPMPASMRRDDWLARRGDMSLEDLMLAVAMVADPQYLVEATRLSGRGQLTLSEYLSHNLVAELYLASDEMCRLTTLAAPSVAVERIRLTLEIEDELARRQSEPGPAAVPTDGTGRREAIRNLLQAYALGEEQADQVQELVLSQRVDVLVAVLETAGPQIRAARLLLLASGGEKGWLAGYSATGAAALSLAPLGQARFATLLEAQLLELRGAPA